MKPMVGDEQEPEKKKLFQQMFGITGVI